jgi:hypothetical protein
VYLVGLCEAVFSAFGVTSHAFKFVLKANYTLEQELEQIRTQSNKRARVSVEGVNSVYVRQRTATIRSSKTKTSINKTYNEKRTQWSTAKHTFLLLEFDDAGVVMIQINGSCDGFQLVLGRFSAKFHL